jgi:hypothetical protein
MLVDPAIAGIGQVGAADFAARALVGNAGGIAHAFDFRPERDRGQKQHRAGGQRPFGEVYDKTAAGKATRIGGLTDACRSGCHQLLAGPAISWAAG